MSYRGIPQLQRLLIKYCDIAGSSVGAREYIANGLVQFAKDNPSVQVVARIQRSNEPHIVAEYVTGRTKQVGIKNADATTVAKHVALLRSQTGHKARSWKKGVYSEKPSIQGVWHPYLEFPTPGGSAALRK